MSYTVEHTEIVNNTNADIRSGCEVRLIHVKINDAEQRLKTVIDAINDTTWCQKMADDTLRKAYKAARDKTVKKLMAEIFNQITVPISVEAGEYVISLTAQDVLTSNFEHTHIPLAELWKEKSAKNPGFDFHTITQTNLILFGEAKFSKNKNRYAHGLEQTSRFIDEKKDKYDKTFLMNIIADKTPLDNLDSGARAFCVAFSLHTCRPKQILRNAVKQIKEFHLDKHPEFFVIGVEICQ